MTATLDTSKDASLLYNGDSFELTVTLKVSRPCKFGSNIMVSSNGINSHKDYFYFPQENLSIQSEMNNLTKVLNLYKVEDGISFSGQFINIDASPFSTQVSINFTLTIIVTNKITQNFPKPGKLTLKAGKLLFTKSFTIVGTICKPELLIMKESNVIGDDSSIYETSITIKNNQKSHCDAFDLKISESVYYMEVTSLRVVSEAQSSSTISKTFPKNDIVGYISLLGIGKSASIIHLSSFIRNENSANSSSKANVLWSNKLSGTQKFGPIYSQSSCAVKNVEELTSFIDNYGFIILGIIIGILTGCFIAAITILCVKRFGPRKSYLIHTDEVNEDESIIKPARYDMGYGEEKDKEINNGNQNFFQMYFKKNEKVAVNKPIKGEPPTPYMWQTSFLKGDLVKTNNLLTTHFHNENRGLQEFALNMWTYIWRRTIVFHIDTLMFDKKINLEKRNEFVGQLVTVLQPVKCNLSGKKNTGDIIVVISETILKHNQNGIKFFQDLLDTIKIKIERDNSIRSKDPDVLKQIEEKEKRKKEKVQKEFIHYHSSLLHEDFISIFNKYLEILHSISNIIVDEQLFTVSTCILFIILKQSINLIHIWIKHTVAKSTDSLKKKRLLKEDVDKSFQLVLNDELESLVSHLTLQRQRVVELSESKSVLNYRAQLKGINKRFSEIYDRLLPEIDNYIQDIENEDRNASVQKIISKFMISLQYKDSIKQICNKNSNFNDVIVSLINSLSQPLNIFYLRMKTRVHDIYSQHPPESVDEFRNYMGDVVELKQAVGINHLSVVMTSLEQNSNELVNKITLLLEGNNALLRESRDNLVNFHNDSALKRKNKIFDLATLRQTVLKCIIQCHCPLSWENCVMITESAPKDFVSAFCELNISCGSLENYNFLTQVDRITKNISLEIGTSSILRKFESINEEVVNEIDGIYTNAIQGIGNGMSNSCTKYIERVHKGTLSNLLLNIKRLKRLKYGLNLTNTFLINILSDLEEADGIRDESQLMQGLVLFCKKVKKTMNSLTTYMTTEAENELRLKIDQGLVNYLNTCKSFVLQTFSHITDYTFDIDEICSSIIEIGRHYKYVNDRITITQDLIAENRKLIKLLFNDNLVSEGKLFLHLKDLFMCLLKDEHQDVIHSITSENESISMQDIISSIVENRCKEASL